MDSSRPRIFNCAAVKLARRSGRDLNSGAPPQDHSQSTSVPQPSPSAPPPPAQASPPPPHRCTLSSPPSASTAHAQRPPASHHTQRAPAILTWAQPANEIRLPSLSPTSFLFQPPGLQPLLKEALSMLSESLCTCPVPIVTYTCPGGSLCASGVECGHASQDDTGLAGQCRPQTPLSTGPLLRVSW
ncbi:uncharacterized protein LOC106509064 [Sus scrofa]|uniref:uncharacterized protein LOC106509064 n=1 Tax=Sus scrofa TaxID=9823 RepID=UPI0006B211E6|nr:uncharacterized protein LOC106509064 [Sus scrofa]